MALSARDEFILSLFGNGIAMTSRQVHRELNRRQCEVPYEITFLHEPYSTLNRLVKMGELKRIGTPRRGGVAYVRKERFIRRR